MSFHAREIGRSLRDRLGVEGLAFAPARLAGSCRRRGAEPAPTAASRAILGLKAGACRWPLGDARDDDFRFCGAARGLGPYCAEHARMERGDASDRI